MSAQKQSSNRLWVLITVGIVVLILSNLLVWSLTKNALTPTSTPTPTEAEEKPISVWPSQPDVCRVIHDYALVRDMTEVATHQGGWLHVEFYTADGLPEYEVLLEGGRYVLTRPLRGHVWEYPKECTSEQVGDQIMAHIERRKASNANNAGYVDWEQTGLFIPASGK